MSDSLMQTLEQRFDGLRRVALDNGMVVLLMPTDDAPTVSIQAWVRAGSIHEQEHLGKGLTHLVEHMIFKGTEHLEPNEIWQRIHGAGGDMNAYTTLDRTVFHVDLPSDHWTSGLNVLADVLTYPAFPQGEWEKEKQVVLREMAMGRDDPRRVAHRLLMETAYRVHPMQVPVIGYEDLLRRATRDDLLDYFHKHYRPDNLVLAVAGAMDPAEAEAKVRSAFADFKRRPHAPVVLPEEPPQLAPRKAHRKGPFSVSRLHWAYHTVPLTHPDAPALDVLASIVGQGRSSRLNQSIREEQQLVYTIDAWSYTPLEPGLFSISATFPPRRSEDLVRALHREVKRWSTTAFSEQELEKARRRLLMNELRSLRSTHGLASAAAAGEFFAGDPTFTLQSIERLQAVTLDDVQRVASTWLGPDNRTTVLLEPETTPAPEAGDGPAAAAAAHPPAVVETEVLGGVPLLVRSDDRLPLVSIVAVLQGGLLSEQEGSAGYTRLMAELLLRGTDEQSSAEIAREADSLGAQFSAFSGHDTFGLQIDGYAGDLEQLAGLLGRSLARPAFDETEVAKQRNIQIGNLRKQQERPLYHAAREVRRALFPDHPYQHTPVGTEEALQAADAAAIRDHYASLVTRSNLVLAVFGDVEAADASRIVEEALSPIPDRAPSRAFPEAPEPAVPTRADRRLDFEQAVTLLGYPGITHDHRQADAARILERLLSGLSSDLAIDIREERGLVYYVGASNRIGIHPGAFVLYAGTREDALKEVEKLMRRELERLAEDGPRPSEMDRARRQLLHAYSERLQNNTALARDCARDELLGLGYAHALQWDDRLARVSREDVRALAGTLFDPEKAVLSIIRPLKDSE